MPKLQHFAVLALLITTGCGSNAGLAPVADEKAQPEAVQIGGKPAKDPMVQGYLRVFNAAGFRLMDTLTAYNPADIKKLTLHLLKQNGSSFTNVADTTIVITATSQLSAPININNLKMGSSYKVNTEAYTTGDVRIDTTVAGDNTSTVFATASLVPGSSGDTIDTTTLNLVLPVKLANKTYSGQGSSNGVAITNGTIVDTSATESF